MPVPPGYDRTLRIYFHLRGQANPDGEVVTSMRKIAEGMGYKSWSTIRWHILHLEECGLVTRRQNDSRATHKIYVRNMDLDDPEMVYDLISSTPRSSWHNRRKQLEGVK